MNKNVDISYINPSVEGDSWFKTAIGRLCLIDPDRGRKHRARLIGFTGDGFIFENREGHQWFLRRDAIVELIVLGEDGGCDEF